MTYATTMGAGIGAGSATAVLLGLAAAASAGSAAPFGPGGAGPTFAPPVKFPADGPVRTSAVGDFDLDGDADVVALLPDDGVAAGRVQIFLNLGRTFGGTWLGLDPQPPVAVGVDPTAVSVGFLDDDPFLDVATSNAGDDTLTLRFGDGTGGLPVAQTIPLAAGAEPSDVAIAELTGNGRADLAVTQRGLDTVLILSNDASVLLGGSIIVSTAQTIAAGDEPSAIDPEDMDNDKDTDLVFTNELDDTVQYARDDPGGFVNEQTIDLDPGDAPVDIIARDVDGNGLGDIAVALGGGPRVAVIRNVAGALTGAGGGPFGAPEFENVGGVPTSITAGDYDLDGDADLAVTALDMGLGPAVRILENLLDAGPLDFALLPALDVDAAPNHVLTADLDGDGRPDLVTSNDDSAFQGQGSLTVLLNLVTVADLPVTEGEGDADCLAATGNPGAGPNDQCATTSSGLACNGAVVGTSGTWSANPPCAVDADCDPAQNGCDLVTGTCVDPFTFRDLDWYDLNFPVDVQVAFRMSAALPVNLFLFQEAPDCTSLVTLFGFAGVGGNVPLVVEGATYPAGDYKLLATFDFASGARAAEPYLLEVLCEIPCPADLDGNGSVGFTDLNAILGTWGPCPTF